MNIPFQLNLKAGELVEVRSKQEILATLDHDGCLDGLPFMPEMFAWCGRRVPVYKRAHKTCDTVDQTGGRRMENAVHLGAARCSGAAHGGCQAECLIFWKEAWLKRVGSTHDINAPSSSDTPDGHCTESAVVAACRQPAPGSLAEPLYRCQATQLLVATTPLSNRNLKQYWEDYASGNVGLARMFGVLCYATHNALLKWSRPDGLFRRLLYWVYNGFALLRGKPRHPRAAGKIAAGAPTPSATLNLQPGEIVRVKTFDQILATIDEKNKNRGMTWDAEMVPYCGHEYRVLKRVDQIIDEKTGKMLHFKSASIILEGAICEGKYSECRYLCPRSIYSYWREIWLERVNPAPVTTNGQSAPAARPQTVSNHS